jgi:XTP/dITP diphosphohydrolase
MEVLLASNNRHKRLEIEGIFDDLGVVHSIVQPRELGFSFDVDETGMSFAENARLKAVGLSALIRGTILDGVAVDTPVDEITTAVAQRFGDAVPPVLADDSGVCVHALDDRPGIYSARFGNTDGVPPLSDNDRNALLLETIRDHSDRGAHYVCNAICVLDPERYIQAEETWHGEIATEEHAGDTGFGYDPVFWIQRFGRTVAQISQAQKNRISHRAKAIGLIARALAWNDAS